jgi:hypothetical protein
MNTLIWSFEVKLFKFRDVKKPNRVLEIILQQRLYCSDLESLNDPLEGIFAFYTNQKNNYGEQSEKIRAIQECIKTLKVCSLSKTFDSHLLWAHYANGFKGITIEVEIPDSHTSIREVKYGGVFSSFNIDNHLNAEDVAIDVLTSKFQDWSYEKEVRVIQRDNYFQLESPVTRVIAGCKMPKDLFDAFNIICANQKIPFRRLGIGDEGLDPDNVKPPEDFSSQSYQNAVNFLTSYKSDTN